MHLRALHWAAAGRMGRRQALRSTAGGGARPPWRARPAELVAGQPGLGQRPSEQGGELTVRVPRPGQARHEVSPARRRRRLPLNVAVSGANRNDTTPVEPIRTSMPAIKGGGRGHPCRRPLKWHAGKGYDVPRVRRHLPRPGIAARIARGNRDSSPRLGRQRRVLERALGWRLSYNVWPCATTARHSSSPPWRVTPSSRSALDDSRRTHAAPSTRRPGARAQVDDTSQASRGRALDEALAASLAFMTPMLRRTPSRPASSASRGPGPPRGASRWPSPPAAHGQVPMSGIRRAEHAAVLRRGPRLHLRGRA